MRKPPSLQEMDQEDLLDLAATESGLRRCPDAIRGAATTYRRDLPTAQGYLTLHICSVCHGLRAAAPASQEMGRP